jgi:hypothetical protein
MDNNLKTIIKTRTSPKNLFLAMLARGGLIDQFFEHIVSHYTFDLADDF